MPFIAWLVSKISGEALKAGGEIAKTATEIPKNIVETEKARLEVDKLDAERRDRERLIVPATFEDVRRYDPKVAYLDSIQACAAPPTAAMKSSPRRFGLLAVLAFLAALAGVVKAIISLLH